jgi:hypothetical protein
MSGSLSDSIADYLEKYPTMPARGAQVRIPNGAMFDIHQTLPRKGHP